MLEKSLKKPQLELFDEPNHFVLHYCKCCGGSGHHGNPYPKSELFSPCFSCDETGKVEIKQFKDFKCSNWIPF